MAAAPRLPLFDLSPELQRAWLAQRLARPAPPERTGLERTASAFRAAKARPFPPPCSCRSSIGRRDCSFCSRSAAPNLPDHPGQISFPGGRLERCDADHAAAALRETAEEIGLPPANVDVLGQLCPYETVTGYRVLPVVGWIEPPFELAPDPVEVADVFEVPLDFILDTANHQRHHRMLGTIRRDYWAIPWLHRYIWGATAAMLLILERTLRDD